MAITTYTAYVAALATATVTGVTRQFTAPPAKLDTADLPASWPMLPSGTEGKMTFCSQGGWPQMTVDMIYALEPVGQSTGAANFTGTLALLDNLDTALRALRVGKSALTWNTSLQIVQIGNTAFWAVVANITGAG
jgi:hypothetical protein